MKSLLRSKDWWKTVNGEEKEPEALTKSSSSNPSTSASSLKETCTAAAEKDEDDPTFVKSLAGWHTKSYRSVRV